MEGCKFLVEINGEKVECPRTSIDCCRIVPEDIVEVRCGFCCDGTYLFVAAGVSWYEENRDTFHLSLDVSTPNPTLSPKYIYLGVLIDAILSVKVNSVFAGKACMFGIEVGQRGKCWPHI